MIKLSIKLKYIDKKNNQNYQRVDQKIVQSICQRSFKKKKKNHLSLPLKMCCSLLLSFVTLTEHTSYAIKFSPFLLNICEFQRNVQPNTVSTIEVGVYVLSPLLSLILSIWRWKDLSYCFLLLHYLLQCAALLAGFISDFAGCFLASLWNVFLTPNNPLPAFPLCSLPFLW